MWLFIISLFIALVDIFLKFKVDELGSDHAIGPRYLLDILLYFVPKIGVFKPQPGRLG